LLCFDAFTGRKQRETNIIEGLGFNGELPGELPKSRFAS
jgi:hypothetical protein